MNGFEPLDLIVLAAYLLGVTAWGAWLGRGQTSGKDYFLGNRNLPWWAVMFSVVATETSTLTFLSIPGVSYLGTLGFLQITIGYLLGRIAVALLFLPAYYKGDVSTAYQLLERPLGKAGQRLTSAIFMITRLMADSVRLFATAIPLALITGWPYPVSIAVIGVLTVVYTYFGGIKAVVWVDALQLCLYLVGAAIAVVALNSAVPGGWTGIFQAASDAGKLDIFNFNFELSQAYTIWSGVIAGSFFAMASHGTDQLLVQRLLTCRDLRDSQRALMGSGVVVMAQFALFLIVGLGLWAFYNGRAFDTNDEIFATFIVQELPAGVSGFLIAGVFAAAMSSLSSSVNSLASTSTYDFWAPMRGLKNDDVSLLGVGKLFTMVWAGLLIGGAILFIPIGRQTTAVEVALAIASMVYGGLLGAFFLGVFSKRVDPLSGTTGIVVGILTIVIIWSVPSLKAELAWPWFVPVGAAITFLIGHLFGRGNSQHRSPTEPTA